MFAIGVAAHLDSRHEVELPMLEEKSIWNNENVYMKYWLLPRLGQTFRVVVRSTACIRVVLG